MSQNLPQSLESVFSWSRIYRNLQQLRRNTWLSSSELKKMQAKRLGEILKHAYENVAFYHQMFNSVKVKPKDIRSVEDLQKIPVITKSDVQKNFKSLIAKGVEIGRLCKRETSGSTGIPLTVIAEKSALYVRKANELRHYVENGGKLLRDKFAVIGVRRPPHKSTRLGSFFERLGIFRILRMSSQDPVEDVFNRLVDFGPDVIKASPSFLLLLAREMEKRGKMIRPRLILSIGELLDTRSRKLISSAFGVEMFDGYGCIESGYIAWECFEHAGYHINTDLIVTEFVKDGEHVTAGETGEIILTPLWNYAMPLIRYKVGDVGTPSNESCPCGRGLPLMKIIEGRLDDFIILPSGRIISPLIIPLFVENIEGIAEYRIIQERKDYFIIQIELKDGYKADTFPQLRDSFTKELGENVEVDIEFVDAVVTGGKLRRVVSKCLPREHFVSRKIITKD